VIDTEVLFKPHIRLYGPVDDVMFHDFQKQMDAAPEGKDLVIELMTFGGDAEVGRRIALDIRKAEKLGRNMHFIGKTVVYSAGVTIMASFPRANRYLTDDTVLLIHDRQIDRNVDLRGPISACIAIVKATLSQLEIGQQLEKQGFDELIAGSDISQDEIYGLASTNWYLTANEALTRKLVARVL
jgi:hypothetical protein